MMENPEEVLSWLEEAARRRPATIPRELDEYLAWVARTGDSVYRWPLVRSLLKEKLQQVLHEFRSLTPPSTACSPNVPPFDAEAMRAVALARLDAFPNPPFTIQRICELLAHPRRHYNRLDKFMRAFEKNVLVVSTKEPEPQRRQPPPPSSAPSNDYDDDTDTEEPCYPRSLNGPLLPHEPSSSTDEQENLSPGRRSDPETASVETPYVAETKPDETAKSSDVVSPPPTDYNIDTNEDTMSVQTAEDSEVTFRSAEDDAPIVNDDGDNASDVKSEDESVDPVKPPSPPPTTTEPDTPTEESSKMIVESTPIVQDDAQIDTNPATPPSLPPMSTDDAETTPQSPKEAQPIDVTQPVDKIEKSSTPPASPLAVTIEDTVESNSEEDVKDDVAESPTDDNIDVTNVASNDETNEPMDCAEEKVEPTLPPPSEVASSVLEANDEDEKMITEDSTSSSEIEQVPQQE